MEKMAKAVPCIRWTPGSNIGCHTGYPDWDFFLGFLRSDKLVCELLDVGRDREITPWKYSPGIQCITPWPVL
jgi:hypothetical protein